MSFPVGNKNRCHLKHFVLYSATCKGEYKSFLIFKNFEVENFVDWLTGSLTQNSLNFKSVWLKFVFNKYSRWLTDWKFNKCHVIHNKYLMSTFQTEIKRSIVWDKESITVISW